MTLLPGYISRFGVFKIGNTLLLVLAINFGTANAADISVDVVMAKEMFFKNEPLVVKVTVHNNAKNTIGLCYSYCTHPTIRFFYNDDAAALKLHAAPPVNYQQIKPLKSFEYYLALESFVKLNHDQKQVQCHVDCAYMLERKMYDYGADFTLSIIQTDQELSPHEYLKNLFSAKSIVKSDRDAQFSCARHIDSSVVLKYIETNWNDFIVDTDHLIDLLDCHKNNKSSIPLLIRLLHYRELSFQGPKLILAYNAINSVRKIDSKFLIEQIEIGREYAVLEFLKGNEKESFFPEAALMKIR